MEGKLYTMVIRKGEFFFFFFPMKDNTQKVDSLFFSIF